MKETKRLLKKLKNIFIKTYHGNGTILANKFSIENNHIFLQNLQCIFIPITRKTSLMTFYTKISSLSTFLREKILVDKFSV